MRRLAYGAPVAALLFNTALCFLSTRGMHTGKALVSAIELGIVGLALLLVWREGLAKLAAPAGLLLLNLVALYLFSGSTDLKIAVDCAIPAAFYLLGQRYADQRGAERLFLWCALLVLGFGLWEMFALPSFEHYFHVFDYFVQKGALDQSHAGDTGTLLAENGVRPGDEGRQLLPGLLSLHRAGSVFLEPVSAGDFAAICVAFVVAMRNWRWSGLITLGAGIATGVLADARFSIVSAAAIALFLASPLWRWRGLVGALPVLAVAMLALTGAVSHHEVDNSILGRLTGSGALLDFWSAGDWFGLGGNAVVSMDTGFSDVIGNLGWVATAAVWFAACRAVPREGPAGRLFAAASLYLTLSLCISSSALSIKTGGLLWFGLGALAAAPVRVPAARPLLRRRAPYGRTVPG